jgi:hypothetical protein
VKNFSDIVQCYGCRRKGTRRETVILQTPKGKFRLCRDCYAAYEESKLEDDYKETKNNFKYYNVQDMDAYEVIKRREKFIKDIKGGLYG